MVPSLSHKPAKLSSPARRFRQGLGYSSIDFSLKFGIGYYTLRSIEDGVKPSFGPMGTKAYTRAGCPDVAQLQADQRRWREDR